MPFPKIAHINTMLPVLDGNIIMRDIAGDSKTPSVYSFFYMVQGQDTFSGENSDLKREARGICFYGDGTIMSRPMQKFFNIGEKPHTMDTAIAWNQVKRVMVKRDGSMVHPIYVAGNLILKTKKSFTSPEAIAATELLKANPDQMKWVVDQMKNGQTPIFEFTSPNFPIVVSYQTAELTLLHIRNNISGDYIDIPNDGSVPFPIVEDVRSNFEKDGIVSFELIKNWCMTATHVEGIVVQLQNGEMVKAKTQWYADLHRTIVFIRVRDVVEAVLNDNVDDMIGAFRMCGRPEKTVQQVETIRNTVLDEVNKIRCAVQSIVSTIPVGMSRKDIYSIFAKNSYYPSEIMMVYDGKSVDWIELYRKRFLKKWPLDVIVDNAGD